MTTATTGRTAARTGREAAVPGFSTRRHWRIPPPLLQDGQGPGPEGLGILEEFRSELGAVLWKTLRSVLLWAEEDPHTRGRLFEEGAAERRKVEIVAGATGSEDAPLREALEDLLSLLHRPDRADPELAGLACRRIATWADARGAPNTALEYLQAAAVCVPANPQYALDVGRAATRLDKHGRAEAWIHRSIGLSRQAGDWKTYVWAYLDHGEMMLQRGALPAARTSIVKALRRARRQGVDGGELRALRSLFVLEAKAGNRSEALSVAREALDRPAADREGARRLARDLIRRLRETRDTGSEEP